MNRKKIAVLGGGNAGFALAGYFSHLGHSVNLYKKSLSNNDSEMNYKVFSKGVVEFKSTINLVTNSIVEALEEAELIFITVPAYHHNALFDEIIGCLNENTTIYLMPDNYGCYLLKKKLLERGLGRYRRVLSLNSFLFACRQITQEMILIKGVKNTIKVSSIYEEVIDEGLSALNDIYPIFVKSTEIIDVQLSNMNPVVHTATTLMNTGWIETTKGNFDFYSEGISFSVANVIESIDKERIELGKKLGFEMDSLLTNMQKLYNSTETNLYSALTESFIHTKDLGPQSLDTRYINEDIPYGLMPMSALGKKLNVQTKAIDTVISLAEITTRKEFDKTASINLIEYLNNN
jgi:opine dehydrogenase